MLEDDLLILSEALDHAVVHLKERRMGEFGWHHMRTDGRLDLEELVYRYHEPYEVG